MICIKRLHGERKLANWKCIWREGTDERQMARSNLNEFVEYIRCYMEHSLFFIAFCVNQTLLRYHLSVKNWMRVTHNNANRLMHD